MSFVRNNIAVLAVFALVASYAWVFGGTRGDILPLFVPWVWAIMAEVALCFPQRREGENSYTARERVWEDLKADPLFWTSFALVALLLVPFGNTGLCPLCDYVQIATEKVDPAPAFPFLPFCVNRLDHLNVVLWFGPCLTAMLAVKHSLNKGGKILLLKLIVWNGVALAVLGYIQQLSGATGPLWLPLGAATDSFFSTFGYPNMAGDMFVTLFCMAVALWRSQVQACNDELAAAKVRRVSRHRLFWEKHHDLIPAVLFFFASVSTLSRATIILVVLSAAVLGLHAVVSFFHRMKKAQRVRTGAVLGFFLLAIVFVGVHFMPKDVQREIDTLSTDAVLTRVTGKGQYHVRVATAIWKEHPLFGCGGWGYKHFCIPAMTKEEYQTIQVVGGINVHNDYLQFLAEHGLVGFGLMVAIVVLLVWPTGRIWAALARDIRFAPARKQPPQPRSLFVLPPAAFALLWAAVATLIHSFGDCPLRSPAVLSLFFVELAVVDGFLPRIEFKQER